MSVYLHLTLWLFNIAMENGPFIDGLPIKHGDFPWRTVSHNQRVTKIRNHGVPNFDPRNGDIGVRWMCKQLFWFKVIQQQERAFAQKWQSPKSGCYLTCYRFFDLPILASKFIWLVIWNMTGLWFSICWEYYHPNCYSLIFFRGVGQPPTGFGLALQAPTKHRGIPSSCRRRRSTRATWPIFRGFDYYGRTGARPPVSRWTPLVKTHTVW